MFVCAGMRMGVSESSCGGGRGDWYDGGECKTVKGPSSIAE